MANIIQIKHGTGEPNNKLAPYELGYMDDSGHLYIGGPYEDEETKTYGRAKTLNYLHLDENGYIPTLYSDGNLTLSSTAANPKLWMEASAYNSQVSYGLAGSSGQAYILEYPPDGTFYERYNLPVPATDLTSNKTYTILTSKGGTFSGTFTFSSDVKVSGKLTANGAIVVDDNSYGTTNPNDAGISGTTGQLYFVLVEE